MNRVGVLALGYGFLVLGVLGLVLPFLQGVLFICVGLIILSRHARWAERLLGRLKAQHPQVARAVVAAEELAERALDRVAVWSRQLVGRLWGQRIP
jgi:sulfite exporter TauE/SafE